MPTKEELRTLIDYAVPSPGPTIDTDYSPSIAGPDATVWSSSPDASSSDYAWRLQFYSGNDGASRKDYSHYVRLVRGGQ